MATLEKIRSKGPLLLIIVGLALLAFIVGDALTNGSAFFQSSQMTVANIEGEKYDYNEFNTLIEQLSDVYKIEQRSSDIDEQTMEMIRSSVWENLVSRTLLEKEAEKIGLTIGKEELEDYLSGTNIHPVITQRLVFADENGVFSRQQLAAFLTHLQTQPQQDDANYAEWQRLKSYWDYWVELVRFSVLQQKYNALLSKAVVANNLETKLDFDASQTNFDVNYVSQSYFTVPDSAVSVSDKEITAYFNAHKALFKQDESRNLIYVSFEVRPSQKDYQEVEQWINALAEEFRTAEDVAEVVNLNSDVSYNEKSLYSQTTVPAHLKEFAFNSPVGAVFGPSFENDTYTMARVMETGIMKPDSVKLRYMFITGDDAAKKADSVKGAVAKGADFMELSAKYSAIPATTNTEVWLTEDVNVADREIVEDAFKTAVNGTFSIEQAQGTQLFQVLEKTAPRQKLRLAILERKVTPSDETRNTIYNQAEQLIIDSKTIDDLRATAKEKNYILREANEVLQSTANVGGIQQSRQIIRWAFENKKGAVAQEVFNCNNSLQYVVAAVTDLNKSGYRSLATVTPQIRTQLAGEKKGDYLVSKIAEQLKSNPDLTSLAAALGTEVQQASGVNFASTMLGATQEAAVVGKITTLQPQQISAPIKGNSGVYVVQITAQQPSDAIYDEKTAAMQAEMRMAYYLPYTVSQDLRRNAHIKDNRLRFY